MIASHYDTINISILKHYNNNYELLRERFKNEPNPRGTRGSSQKIFASARKMPPHLSRSTRRSMQGSNTSLMTALAETIHASEDSLHEKLY
jgi:hypothetical protein